MRPVGDVAPLPQSGTLYTPGPNCPQVRAFPFKGRATVDGWRSTERDRGDGAPPERYANIMAAWDRGAIDPIRWVRIPVAEGLEVEVPGDVVSLGGVRLCGPMRAAQHIADEAGALLMTPGIVRARWRAKTLALAPRPINVKPGPGNPGGAVPWMLYEADLVQAQLQGVLAARQEELGWVAFIQWMANPALIIDTLGKSYVLEARLPQNAGQCAIFGWYQPNGTPTPDDDQPIQSKESGASFIHPIEFFDYSQSLDFVRARAWLDGKEIDLAEVYRTKPDLVNYKKGLAAPPTRHPAIPKRSATVRA